MGYQACNSTGATRSPVRDGETRLFVQPAAGLSPVVVCQEGEHAVHRVQPQPHAVYHVRFGEALLHTHVAHQAHRVAVDANIRHHFIEQTAIRLRLLPLAQIGEEYAGFGALQQHGAHLPVA